MYKPEKPAETAKVVATVISMIAAGAFVIEG
jgi:hypothetical protein